MIKRYPGSQEQEQCYGYSKVVTSVQTGVTSDSRFIHPYSLLFCCDSQAAFRFVKTSKSIKKFKSKSDVGIQVSLVGLENGGAVKVSCILYSQCDLKVNSLQSCPKT